jgi:hypothetical protein
VAGYSLTPLFKKLGYKDGIRAHVVGAPATYRSALQLPKDLHPNWIPALEPELDLIHLFVGTAADLRKGVKMARKNLAPAGALWVSWPKKASGVVTDVTEDAIRETVFPFDLVDIKVCAVDETWSGLQCVIRKAKR